MKVFIVLAACVVGVSAGGAQYGAGPLAAITTGQSSQFRQEDNYGNYNFGYDESHATGGSSRREEQTNGIRRGMYSLSDADGRRRIVNYVADANGFRATVETNEPGVEPKDSADVLVNKGAAVLAAPAQGYAAPAPLAAPLAAPVKGYLGRAPLPAAAPAPVYSQPAPIYAQPAPVYADPIAETPRAFSYSFGSTHLAPAAPAYQPAAPVYQPAAPAPIYQSAAPAPVYQQRLEY